MLDSELTAPYQNIIIILIIRSMKTGSRWAEATQHLLLLAQLSILFPIYLFRILLPCWMWMSSSKSYLPLLPQNYHFIPPAFATHLLLPQESIRWYLFVKLTGVI